MKAIELTKDDAVNVVEVPKPSLTSDDAVLVRVRYAAMDTATDQFFTWMGSMMHAKTDPTVLGWHFSGTVEEIGKNVTSKKVGDDVFGFLPHVGSNAQGSYSEYLVVPTDSVAVKPAKVSHEVAAASSVEGLTALQGLRNEGGLEEGSKVLVVGAAGGVGSLAVAIAKRLGASRIAAVCSTKDVERVQSYGSDYVLDRKQHDFLAADQPSYDVIFDAPSAYSPLDCMTKLQRKGTYVATLPTFSLLLGMLVSFFSSKNVKGVLVHGNETDLALLGGWLEDGMMVEIDKIYPIKDFKAALQRQRERSKVGRVVLKVDGGWE